MAHSLRRTGIATAALALLLSAAGPAVAGNGGRNPEPANRSVEVVHQPVVERTDYVLDLRAGPRGLAFGEPQRLAGWFDGLSLGYGDTIMLDEPMGGYGGAAQDNIAAVVSHYGMLVSHDAPPVTAGRPAPGTIRIVVSRATARVQGCPDWSRDNSEYSGGASSNYGCATETNLAAMIANPEDLVRGERTSRPNDPSLSVKAIQTYRDAKPTGAGGVKAASTGGGQ